MKAPTQTMKNREWRISGTTLVSGMAVGRAFFLGNSPLQIHELTLPQEEVEHEIHRYYKALSRSKSDIVALEKETKGKQGHQEIASILQAHLEIIKDPILTEEVVNTIREDRKNAEYVFSSVMGRIEESLTAAQDIPLASDRIQDIHDVSNRVIGHLCCQHKRSLGEADQNIIVFSKELTPSEVASANPSYIRGFVSLIGASTSHTTIVSRAKGIPYVANFSQKDWEKVQEYSGKLVLIDGSRSEIIFNPEPKTLDSCYKRKNVSTRISCVCPQNSPCVRISVQAASLHEVQEIIALFPEMSIGLFRSEFLAICKKRLPTYEEQLMIYRMLADPLRPISSLRLFDFGEDKRCPGETMRRERSVRYLLNNMAILDTQLLAILAASKVGPLKILLPGVADVAEILAIKRRCITLSHSCTYEYDLENLSWGVMIELPSAVMMIDEIVLECDFISIGTNDLMQYTLGNSRECTPPEYLNVSLHPAVVRMIHRVVCSARQRGIATSVCGEAAADLSLTPFFLGLGIQELTVAPSLVHALNKRIHSLDPSKCMTPIKKVLRAKTYQEIQSLFP